MLTCAQMQSGEKLTEVDKEVLMMWMDRSGCHTVYRKETVHLVTQTLFIHFIFRMRIRQIEAIAVRIFHCLVASHT